MTYDLGRQLKAIEAFEAQAVKGAEETKVKVDTELRRLEATLKNIEEARPFEDLTVVSFFTSWLMMVIEGEERGFEGVFQPGLLTVFVRGVRTKLQLPIQRSTSGQSSWYLRASGCLLDTRYALPIFFIALLHLRCRKSC